MRTSGVDVDTPVTPGAGGECGDRSGSPTRGADHGYQHPAINNLYKPVISSSQAGPNNKYQPPTQLFSPRPVVTKTRLQP